MKSLLSLVLIAVSVPISAGNADTERMLKSGAMTIHHIWTEWMEKPSLIYTSISEDSLLRLYGRWTGSYVEDDEKVNLSVILKADGTWVSEVFRPSMTDGHWYLSDGMMLLFESKISDDADLASALTLNEGKLRLLYADVEAGFVELTKAE